nr:unnamed protein product [Callosobruchus analis]
MVVYPYQRISEKIARNINPKWGVGRSDNGWMTSETFYQYIANVFYPHLKENIILLLDGHKSHLSYQLGLLCNELQIEVISLYPNATRILQPRDVSIFRPMKEAWRQTIKLLILARKQKQWLTVSEYVVYIPLVQEEQEKEKENTKRKRAGKQNNKEGKENSLNATQCYICSRIIKSGELQSAECKRCSHRKCVPEHHATNTPSDDDDLYICRTCYKLTDGDENNNSDVDEEEVDELYELQRQEQKLYYYRFVRRWIRRTNIYNWRWTEISICTCHCSVKIWQGIEIQDSSLCTNQID